MTINRTEMTVTLLDRMGSDLTVVNAARASMNKESTALTPKDASLIKYLARGYTADEWEDLADQFQNETSPYLVKQMMWQLKTKATHFSAFVHPQASFRVEAPLAVARQLWRSHVGVVGGDAGYAAWSEESRRYVDSKPEFYIPDLFRERGSNMKQGSSEDASVVSTEFLEVAANEAADKYDLMIRKGVAPEQARLVLPACTMTSWVWTGSLMFFARLCQIRLEHHTQKESRDVAGLISDIMEDLFPVSWDALMTGGSDEV